MVATGAGVLIAERVGVIVGVCVVGGTGVAVCVAGAGGAGVTTPDGIGGCTVGGWGAGNCDCAHWAMAGPCSIARDATDAIALAPNNTAATGCPPGINSAIHPRVARVPDATSRPPITVSLSH